MLEFVDLARFVAICQGESLSATAKRLQLAPSSLSDSLGSLEAELGFGLFDRTARGLVPNGSARWLFRESVNLLHAESVACDIVRDGAASARQIVVEVRTALTMGHLDKAIGHAMRTAAHQHPGVCFRLEGIDGRQTAEPRIRPGAGLIDLRHQTRPDSFGAPGQHVVGLDPLVIARCGRHPPVDDHAASQAMLDPIRVPRIAGASHRWIRERLRAEPATRSLTFIFTDEDLGSLESLVLDRSRSLLVPRSALSSRLVRRGIAARALPLGIGLPLVATLRGHDPAAAAWVGALRQAFGEPESDLRYHPNVTSKQLIYFDLLCRSSSVTAAAKRAGVAQPAVTEQLRKLEQAISARLFDRTRTGIETSPAGDRFASAATLLEAARNDVALKRLGHGDQASGAFELGILPSVGAGSFLVSRVARAIEEWRQRYPDLRLRILEQPNVTLQERVRRGTLRLGIITTRSPRMARVDLGSSEALALVANPAFSPIAETGPIPFAALAKVPLVLPTIQFGLRQLIDAAGASCGIRLRPALEVDSLAMCLALVHEGRLCTILPPSDVLRQVEAGELSTNTIRNPSIVRTLQIIYATSRSLTEAERDLVKLLRVHLAASEKGIGE